MSTEHSVDIHRGNEIELGLHYLQELCGSTTASKGFHDDRPDSENFQSEGVYESSLANWQGNKLLLIVSEVIEAHDEIRNGHAADETYYPVPKDGLSLQARLEKPEGVPSEIADAVIRCFDFAYTEGFSLADIILEKISYNQTRERLHGKKF
jgi:hypothetical protein